MTPAGARVRTKAEWKRVRAIFEVAMDLAPAAQTAFLAERCGGEAALETEVRRLLELDRASDPALDGPPLPGAQKEGRRIGTYELRRKLGEGGMGSVWLAVQAQGSFHRRVALKLLRSGLETQELRARFERERQVLANLDHPGIARLIDGGVSEQGGPSS